ncbi:hypothetical protein tb265_24660 [Gemmatimonadetes bacterium T265]|nr:hypothetical protein tb265_24660 [Gemmatimonadetes bacterium T265]
MLEQLQDRVGVALQDRFALERVLGRGGMATVYLARDLVDGAEVAVKVLDPDLALAVGGERFRREVEIASTLRHPCILPVLSAGEAGGSLYCVMPYVSGESLRARLDREPQLPVDLALRLTCEIAEALDYAHARGVVHRDIKPGNILIDDGHAIVADFGIAHAVSASDQTVLTKTGVAIGTPAYMSPEQSFGEKSIDGRADVYALGCVLYEMLAGQPPFTGATAQAIMARHTVEQAPSVRIVRPSVPPHVEDAMLQALAKSPADRFASAMAFAEALRAPGPRTGSRQAVRPGHVDRRRQRIRRALYSAGVLLPLVAAGAWMWLHPSHLAADSPVAAKKVAVMYFDDLSPGGRLAPVADGLTEGVIDALARVPQLDVISRHGVEPFRGRDVDADSVSRALGVGTLVRGSVEGVRGDSVRVAVRLVSASTGETVGRPATFTAGAASVLTLRDSVAGKVAEFLRARIGEAVQVRELQAGTSNVTAWTLVRRAERAQHAADSAWTVGDTANALGALGTADSLLAAARAADAKWPEPAVDRATVALRRAEMSLGVPAVAAKALADGLAQADSALALDANNAAALEARGALRFARVSAGLVPNAATVKDTVQVAEHDLREAVRLDPHRAGAWVTLGQLARKRFDMFEAKRDAQRAYQEDAYLAQASDVIWHLFATSYDLEQTTDAQSWCAEGVRRFPDNPRFLRCQLLLMTMRGVTPDPARAWQLLGELERRTPKQKWAYEGRWQRMLVAGAIARAKLPDSARHVLLAARADRDVDPRGELVGFEAFIRTLIGDREQAIDLLGRYLTANPEHREGFVKLNTWWWRDLRGDPRFDALVSG